jgi:hypothetical protein
MADATAAQLLNSRGIANPSLSCHHPERHVAPDDPSSGTADSSL